MDFAAIFTLWVAGAVFVIATGATARQFWSPDDRNLVVAFRLGALGTGLLGLVIALRTLKLGHAPLTTSYDSVNLFLLTTAIISLSVARSRAVRGLLCFYLLPVAIITILNAAVIRGHVNPPPGNLSELALVVHVGAVFVAYSLFFVASLTSAAYVAQVRNLKRPGKATRFGHLPPLEQLDRTLYRLIMVGYPLFVIALILGLLWAFKDSKLLDARWWMSPKTVMAIVMVAFYAFTFHARRRGLLRGRKLAYLVFAGFNILLVSYLAMSLLNVRTLYFWGRGA